MTRLAYAVVCSVVATVTGCGQLVRAGGGPVDQEALESDPPRVELTVENHNWSDVVVSLEHSGRESRLGLIKAASTHRLSFPRIWSPSTDRVRLVARRIGSTSRFRSEIFSIGRGQAVTWTLESDLGLSSLALQ